MTNLNKEELAVYELISSNDRITQMQIVKHEKWLGCHEKHEGHLDIDKQQSTLRKIRSIIRGMRMNKGVAILSDRDGYFIMKNSEQAKEYIERLEKTVKAQQKSWQETYECMSKLFGIKSEYFEKQSNKIKVKAHTRTLNKQTNQSGQQHLF